nr:retrovirus-related Pol polyprotein from transposon TNT 1-94 [Tanacetum cinerariifolium]
SESDESVPIGPVHDRYKSGEGYHAVPPPYTGTFMPLKPDLVFHDASTISETVPTVINVELSPTKPTKDMSHSIGLLPLSLKIGFLTQKMNLRGAKGNSIWKPKCLVLDHVSRLTRIKREFSVARTPQQNGVAERKNRTLIEAVRTMLEDSLLPILFWAEAVNTACYVQHRVLVTKPYNKTPYELLLSRTPSIGFMRPFGCPVTILNTLDPLRKFDGKADEGFLVGYSVNSKAFRLFISRTRIVQETLQINFLENQPNVIGSGPTWLFDIDTLIKSMNYQPVVAENQLNSSAGIQENLNAGTVGKEPVSTQQYVLLPLWSTSSKDSQNTDADASFDDKENKSDVHVSPSNSDKPKTHDEKAKSKAKGKITDVESNSTNSTNSFSAASPSNTVVSPTFEIDGKSSYVDPSQYPDDPNMPALEEIIYSDDKEDVDAKADFSNLETCIAVSLIPTTRVHKDHPVTQIIGDLSSDPQTRSMERMVKEQ